MSDVDLPEDPGQWPRDPYVLLGVKPQDDLVAIRRAYTKLIRRYKPEHFPEQFILLRSAYEHITSVRTSFDPGNDFGLSFPLQPMERTQERSQEDSQNSSEQQASQSATDKNSSSKLDEIWNLASRGLFEQALAELGNQSWQKSELVPVTLANYWITKLQFPAPDKPQAAKLLLKHLHLFRRMPNMMEVAQEELQFHASLVNQIDLSQCLEGLIDVDDMLDIVQLRWTAALRTLQFDLMVEDWSLVERIFRDDKSARAVLALTLLDFLAWSDDADHHAVVDTLNKYLRSDMSSEPIVAAGLERIDTLRSVAEELVSFRTQCSQWKEISQCVPLLWNDVTTEYSAKLCSWLLMAIHEPLEALRFFDDLQLYPYLSKFFVQRMQMLVGEANEFAEPALDRNSAAHFEVWKKREPTSIESELIEEFLSSYNNEPYPQFRLEIARFSLQNNIMPPKICGYIEERETIIASFFYFRFLEKIKFDTGLTSLTQSLCNCLF